MYIYGFSAVATQIIYVRPRGYPWLSVQNSHLILRKNVSFPCHVLYLYYQIEPTNSFSKAEAAEVDLGVVRNTTPGMLAWTLSNKPLLADPHQSATLGQISF